MHLHYIEFEKQVSCEMYISILVYELKANVAYISLINMITSIGSMI